MLRKKSRDGDVIAKFPDILLVTDFHYLSTLLRATLAVFWFECAGEINTNNQHAFSMPGFAPV